MSMDATGPDIVAPAVEPSAAIDHERFFMVRVIDELLNLGRKVLSASLVTLSCRWLAFVGMWALTAFAVLVLVFGLILAIDARTFGPFGAGIGVALLALALLYTAGKFCNAGQAVIDATASELSSRSFLDCLALLAAVLALGTLIGGIVNGIQIGSMIPVGIGFGLGAWWAYLAAVAFNPTLVNLAIRPGASAGQECLGIISFFLKALLRIVPIAFGVATTVGSALFVIGMIRFLASDSWQRMALGAEMAALTGFVLLAAALPLLIYFVVVLAYLLVDLARAILRIRE